MKQTPSSARATTRTTITNSKTLSCLVLSVLVLCLPDIASARDKDTRELCDASFARHDNPELASLLEQARQRSPLLSSAGASLETARAERAAASIRSPYNPRVQIGGGVYRAPDEFGPSARLNIQQRVEINGQRAAREDLAEQTINAARATKAGLCWQTRATLIAHYHALAMRARELELANESLAFSREIARIEARRVEVGEVGKASLLVARTDVATWQQQVARAERALQTERTLLALAAGLPEDALGSLTPELPEPAELPPLTTLIDRAKTSNPELARLRSEQERASSALTLATKEARQDITFGYAHERNGIRVGEAVNVLFIALPIQLWNRNQGNIARAEASIVATSARHDQTLAELSRHLTAAHARAESAREQSRLYRELVSPEIDANLALLLRAYEEGEIDLVTASMGRAKLLEAEARELQNRQEYLDARLDIEALVGPTTSEDTEE